MGSGGYGIARVLQTRQGLATPYFCVPRKKVARTQCRRNDIGRGEGEEEEAGGRGPDSSVKSHVPSRVHRNARAVCMPVSGHARACWWSPAPALSRAQVDGARARATPRYIAPHGQLRRLRSGGGGKLHRVNVEQRWWQRASECSREGARSTVGGTKSRKIQVAP